jgi:membrane AbrB-like protein
MVPGFVVLGALIGTRFAGATWRHLGQVAVPALVAFVIAMCVSVGGAALVTSVLHLPFGLTLLAFAPGGLETMTLLAFALSLDPAYVAAHQVARYVAMVLFLPVLMRLMTGIWPGQGKR